MWRERSERLLPQYTGEVFPGLIVAVLVVAAVCRLPRKGPTFGAMLLSSRKAAEVACKSLFSPAYPKPVLAKAER